MNVSTGEFQALKEDVNVLARCLSVLATRVAEEQPQAPEPKRPELHLIRGGRDPA